MIIKSGNITKEQNTKELYSVMGPNFILKMNDQNLITRCIREIPELSGTFLEKASRIDSGIIKTMIAKHPNINEKTYNKLVNDPYHMVRISILSNPKTKNRKDVIEKLYNDKHPMVKEFAEKYLETA